MAYQREAVALGEEVEASPQHRAHHHHGVQAHQPALEEAPYRHAVPAVVIRIADDEARQHKEEIHSQVPVVNHLVGRPCGIRFQQVEQHYDDGRDAAQPVQNLITWLGSQIHMVCHN